ncbi:MAG TPA: LamG-like jellyroll fold domain-containing protein, partial [Acidimicrobiia bacterium]|nr:LamG-like jellyroll fold domain-containing protein [Acidimicrobiia bacterium]
DFDGSDDLVSIADASELDLTASFTLQAWVRPGSSFATNRAVIVKGQAPGGDISGYSLSAQMTSGKPQGGAAKANSFKNVTGPEALKADTWAHLALTSDTSTLRLYVDGVLEASAPASAAGATNGPLEIGHGAYGLGYFDGLIDEVRIYDVRLSQAQVQADSTDLKGTFAVDVEMIPEKFDPVVTDYAVRCDGENPVEVSATSLDGTQIGVDGQKHAGGAFSTEVAIDPGQAFKVSIQRGGETRDYHVRCLPLDFPSWDYDRLAQPKREFYAITPSASLAVIFDDHGVPVWWHRTVDSEGNNRAALDAKVLDNGWIAYTTQENDSTYHVLEPDGSPVEAVESVAGPGTVKVVGGPTDHHELQRLPNGNFLLISYWPREGVDMTSLCDEAEPPKCAGKEDTVLDSVIQEVTPQGSVAWEWRSEDHIALAETPTRWNKLILTRPERDIVHMNAIEPVGNGAVMFSARHLDAVYKIDKATGNVIWKLGGTPTSGSLTVLNDPQGSYPLGGQHDVRLQADGTITIHDNRTGLGDAPRAVRYEIDETQMTATLVEQVHDSQVSSSFCCGSSRRSDDGSWLMSWGGNSTVTEFGSDEQRTFLLNPGGFSYRAAAAPDGVLEIDELRAGMDKMHPTPIAAYSFDEGTGTTLNDSAANHDGTITGATWSTAGKYGSALDFDGSDDLVSIADASELDLTASFTLQAWVRPGSSFATNRAVIVKGQA